MSRYAKWKDLVGPIVRGQCRRIGCAGVPVHPRGTWCSEACRDDATIRCGIGVRWAVRRRDQGVCAACGVDTEWLKVVHQWLRHAAKIEDAPPMSFEQWRRFGRMLSGLVLTSRSWWEADHIHPVVEGGGGCPLSNYRTLCIPCHRAVTRKLIGRLTTKRTGQGMLMEVV